MEKSLFAVIGYIDGTGVSEVHIRKTQIDANLLAVQIAMAYGDSVDDTPERRSELLETLQEHGVIIDSDWEITVYLADSVE